MWTKNTDGSENVFSMLKYQINTIQRPLSYFHRITFLSNTVLISHLTLPHCVCLTWYFLYSVSSVKMRGHCSCCWYLWYCWPSLFKNYFHHFEEKLNHLLPFTSRISNQLKDLERTTMIRKCTVSGNLPFHISYFNLILSITEKFLPSGAGTANSSGAPAFILKY